MRLHLDSSFPVETEGFWFVGKQFYSVLLKQKCKWKIQMWMWTLAYLALQRKHKEQNLNESSFVKAPDVRLFWRCSRTAFDSWVNLFMGKSFYPHPSGHPLLHSSDTSASSASCHRALDMEFTPFSNIQNVPHFYEFVLNDQFRLSCGWKIVFSCNIVDRGFVVVVVNRLLKVHVGFRSLFEAGAFQMTWKPKSFVWYMFWLWKGMENTDI